MLRFCVWLLLLVSSYYHWVQLLYDPVYPSRRSLGWLVCNNFLKGQEKLHFHAPIGALVIFNINMFCAVFFRFGRISITHRVNSLLDNLCSLARRFTMRKIISLANEFCPLDSTGKFYLTFVRDQTLQLHKRRVFKTKDNCKRNWKGW